MGFSRQEYWSGWHSLLQWTTFCQTSPPWPVRLGWPHMAWLSFIELDKAVVRVIRLASFLWLWFVCLSSDASCNTYRLTWVSLPLDMGYLFMAAPPDLERGVVPLSRRPWPRAWGSSSRPLPLTSDSDSHFLVKINLPRLFALEKSPPW